MSEDWVLTIKTAPGYLKELKEAVFRFHDLLEL